MIKNKKNAIAIFVSALFGLVAFLFIYSELLDPRYTAWMLTAGPDPMQHYLGWVMYRQADWSFPLGIATNYGYPFGVPITYTDSIPLLAIFFKIFRSIIPDNFQYFGLWIMSCFVLQGVFGYLLLNKFLNSKSLAVLGSTIFILSPVMLFRLGGHFALGGHWLILAGLYLFLFSNKKLLWWQWSLLLATSLLVHPYLLFMNGFLLAGYLLKLFIKKTIPFWQAIIFALAQVILVYIVAHSLGLFVIGQAIAPGYGDFSMNLNALVNPMGWSRLLADLPIIRYQAEGFNYLGLGLILLLIFSVLRYIQNKKYRKFKIEHLPLVLVIIALTALSVSHVVALNSNILFSLPLAEEFKDKTFGLFRSSGRFFWPVYYLIVIGAFYVIKNYKFKISIVILILAVAIQVFDLSSKINSRGQEFANKEWSTSVIGELDNLNLDYKHIVFLPVIPHRNHMNFAIFASYNGMTVNDGYFARPIDGLDEERERQIDLIKNGQPDPDTLYVFSRDVEILSGNLDQSKHLITMVDDTTVLLPYYFENKK